jgi:NADP-dependent aldehyde dehydrogenase
MLTPGIKQNYLERLRRLVTMRGVACFTSAKSPDAGGCSVHPCLLKVDAVNWLENASLAGEVFGPAAIFVECENHDQLLEVAAALKGQLTATIHAADGEIAAYPDLLRILERKAGRLIFNGFPTGVEVCDAMVHGGPYPATTDSRFSSVGSLALQRFLRPVCYQNFPDRFLPEPLQESPARTLWRLVEGAIRRDPT